MRSLIYISAFLRKEMYEILRQPRLLLSLILGPFLILLLFGVGYRNEAQALRTLFVVEPDSPFRLYIEEYMAGVSGLVAYAGIAETEEQARAALRNNNVDVAIILPRDPVSTVSRNERAVFDVLHREIDPFNINYINVFSQFYVNEINNRVLAAVVQEGQQGTGTLAEPLAQAQTDAGQLRRALADEDTASAAAAQIALTRSLGAVALVLGSDNSMLMSINEQFGSSGEASGATLVGSTLNRLQNNTARLSQIDPTQSDFTEEAQIAAEIESDLGTLSDNIDTFSRIDPAVLVTPFRYRAESVTPVPIELTDFYVPAVIALLLQHLAVTFAAMSIVRERNEGALELFRIAPISALETLLGKYGGYLIFDALLALILSLLVVLGLGTPLVGSLLLYAATLLVLIFASLSVGFVISTVAQTTTQAVQYAMIMLLASIFFSGFFLGLQLLWEPVRVVSWLLPATYATHLLQNIMLRGTADELDMLATLGLYGLAFFTLAWLLLRRLMAQR